MKRLIPFAVTVTFTLAPLTLTGCQSQNSQNDQGAGNSPYGYNPNPTADNRRAATGGNPATAPTNGARPTDAGGPAGINPPVDNPGGAK